MNKYVHTHFWKIIANSAPLPVQVLNKYGILVRHRDKLNCRVTEISVRCKEESSEGCSMDMEAVYAVALPDFLAEGGAKRVYNFEDVIEDRFPGNR